MRRPDEDGATAVEYALIVAAIAAVIVLVVNVVGQQTKSGLCSGSSAMEQLITESNVNC